MREELERAYKQSLLEAIGTQDIPRPSAARPELQVWTCIDDRSGGLRRHLEAADPAHIETLGVAGFFGVPVRYRPIDGRQVMALAPPGCAPEYELVETARPQDSAWLAKWKERRRQLARITTGVENASFLPVLSVLVTAAMAPVSIARMLLLPFPNATQKITDAFHKMVLPAAPPTLFDLPFPAERAAALLAATFIDIGTKSRFAPLVIVLGHGSRSANNPFFAAYQCGACQGREGSTNARLLARLANDGGVRAILAAEYGITIPTDTHFVGGVHSTTYVCEGIRRTAIPNPPLRTLSLLGLHCHSTLRTHPLLPPSDSGPHTHALVGCPQPRPGQFF